MGDHIEKYTEGQKLKAAYALNMCTVSVSQIVDYNDVYILEKEYDAILNNLNLEQIPKDEALLKILVELLNVITYFRIQEIKKSQIEKRYQQRIQNAIWSAVPSLSVVVSGNPVAIALSLATQIGSGYMNYRKEKANAKSDKENSEIELQITAIEQFNALKRELFTTAWRLADEYGFDDTWRLTEKQIKQYNEILLDQNEYRKYARLESIADKFVAYPPFWYFYGHTANYIAEMAKNRCTINKQETEEDKKKYQDDFAIMAAYTERAKKHFEYYYSLSNNTILREDQLTASCALEYVDLLWNEKNKDKDKIYGLVQLAEKMASTSFDILQLCAISYLKIGRSDDAERLFKILVNEEYNTTANAKLLSRLYVSKYLSTGNQAAYADYKILETQIDPLYLYPMPSSASDSKQQEILEERFLRTQKAILKKAYRLSLDAYVKHQIIEFNSVLPLLDEEPNRQDNFWANTMAARMHRKEIARKILNSKDKAEYITSLKMCGFRAGYIDVLNKTVAAIEELSCFRHLETHDRLVYLIEGRLRLAKSALEEFQAKMDNGSFQYEDYKNLVDNYSYQYFTENFYDKLKVKISEKIDVTSDLEDLEQFEQELIDFCERHKLPAPDEYLHIYKTSEDYPIDFSYVVSFSDELLGENRDNQDRKRLCTAMSKIVQDDLDGLILKPSDASVYLSGSMEFRSYLGNDRLQTPEESLYLIRQKAFAVVDDKSKRDFDLVFCIDGIAVVKKNKIRDTIPYGDIKFSTSENRDKLKLGYPDVYENESINIKRMNGIISRLDKYLRSLENH